MSNTIKATSFHLVYSSLFQLLSFYAAFISYPFLTFAVTVERHCLRHECAPTNVWSFLLNQRRSKDFRIFLQTPPTRALGDGNDK